MVYDVLIIGGGPGGYLAAERAAQGGLKVLLFEKNRIGGVCLNEGCIPSKALLYAAKTLRHAQEGEPFGVVCGDISLNHAAAVARKDRVVKRLTTGVASTLRKLGAEVVAAKATLAGQQDGIFSVEADGTLYKGKRVVLATGSRPATPPIPGLQEGLESGLVLTSREMLSLQEVPATLAVIGGGVIGLELATYYAAAGSSVTIIEPLPSLVATMDEAIGKAMKKECEKNGITVLCGTTVSRITSTGLDWTNEDGNGSLTATAILLATGRVPNSEGLGLERVGLTPEDCRRTTPHGCTTVENLYSIGDLNGRSMLAHTAYREAEVAVNHMLGRTDEMGYSAIAACLYTDPEAAGVGETSQSALQKGLEVETRVLPMNFSGRYMAETNRGEGFCKMLIDKHRQTVVGVHLLGGPATEIIYAASLMVQLQLPISQLQKTVFPHPTVGEILREALFMEG